MHVLITGAAGMLGRKLAESLIQNPTLGTQTVSRLTLVDQVEPLLQVDGFAGELVKDVVDLGAPEVPEALIAQRPDLIFHLAAVVSAEAEADFEKGYRINLDSTRGLLEAIRQQADTCPRFVFASSIAVFGTPFPTPIPETYQRTPLTSYGTQKAIAELLLADYSRRGFLQGIGLRLPTLCIRPGAPNKAASSFFSGILREPLNGEEATLPVAETVRHWHASPRAAVGFLRHAATLDLSALGTDCNLTMPGLAATVQEQLEALERAAGPEARQRVQHAPDPTIERIVTSWPQALEAERAQALGFSAEENFDEIIRVYLEEEGSSFSS